MNYIHIETKEYPLTAGDIIVRHSANVSFPNPFEPLPEYALVQSVTLPEYNAETHYMVEGVPEEKEGEFFATWEVIAYTEAELAEKQAQKEAEEKAKSLVVVPRHKGLLALFQLKGIKEGDISSIISQMEDQDSAYVASIYFKNPEWHNDDPWVIELAKKLDITDAELKELFEYAVTL